MSYNGNPDQDMKRLAAGGCEDCRLMQRGGFKHPCAAHRLESENLKLRAALADIHQSIQGDECRSDEDCDHCHRLSVIDDALDDTCDESAKEGKDA